MIGFFRDLFFKIWADDFGSGWVLLVICLFSVFLALFIVLLFKNKASGKKQISKLTILVMVITLFFAYQLVPIVINYIAWWKGTSDMEEAIKYEKLAIQTSVIPWQRGAYYCTLGQFYYTNKQGKESINAYKNAYQYVKSYKYPCWYLSFITFYNYGDYDTAIEIAKGFKYSSQDSFIAQSYAMKGEYESAITYSNRAIKKAKNPSMYAYALRGYLNKKLGNWTFAKADYAKAMSLATNSVEKERIKGYYTDFNNFENARLKELKLTYGLE